MIHFRWEFLHHRVCVWVCRQHIFVVWSILMRDVYENYHIDWNLWQKKHQMNNNRNEQSSVFATFNRMTDSLSLNRFWWGFFFFETKRKTILFQFTSMNLFKEVNLLQIVFFRFFSFFCRNFCFVYENIRWWIQTQQIFYVPPFLLLVRRTKQKKT